MHHLDQEANHCRNFHVLKKNNAVVIAACFQHIVCLCLHEPKVGGHAWCIWDCVILQSSTTAHTCMSGSPYANLSTFFFYFTCNTSHISSLYFFSLNSYKHYIHLIMYKSLLYWMVSVFSNRHPYPDLLFIPSFHNCHLPTFNPLKTNWFCYNTHFP